MEGRALVPIVAVPALFFCALALGTEEAAPGQRLAFGKMLASLGSADAVVRQAAQEELLSLGPGKVEESRRIAAFLDEVVTMHGRLVAKRGAADEALRLREDHETRTNALEAIQYFASRGAVRYLALGLESEHFYVQIETAQAMAGLGRQVKREQAAAFVSVIAAFLERQRPVFGSDEATAHEMAVESLCTAIGEVAEMGVRGPEMDIANAQARTALQKVLRAFRDGRAAAAAQNALNALGEPGQAAQVPQPVAAPAPAAVPTGEGALGMGGVQALEELGSADVAVRQAAQAEVLLLGPEKVEAARRAAGVLHEIVTMHDKLVDKPSRAAGDSDAYRQEAAAVRRDAWEAIRYFSSRGAVRYLALGLESAVGDARVDTASALSELDWSVQKQQTETIVSIVVSYLDREEPVLPTAPGYAAQKAVVDALCRTMRWVASTQALARADMAVVNAEARTTLQKVLGRTAAESAIGAGARQVLELLPKRRPAPAAAPSADVRPDQPPPTQRER